MLLYIKNEHLSTHYPLLSIKLAEPQSDMQGIMYYDKETGKEYSAINIDTLEQLLTVLSLAKATNEYCTGIFFDGTSLVLSEKPYTLGE